MASISRSFLDDLENQAIANNPQLYIALQRTFEARAIAGIEAANLYPQVTLGPSFTDSRMLLKPFLPPGLLNFPCPEMLGQSNSMTTAANKIAPFCVHQMQHMFPLNLNYEVDLRGRTRSRMDAATFNAEAEMENYLAVLLTLTAEVANSYFHICILDAETAF